MQVADRDLVIATHGRSFWILDNIGVLRQATPAITTENAAPLRSGRSACAASIATSPIDYYLKADSRRP